eukprot:CAMPEP_0170521232 /NCGR_PEP_ID=MMETSP0209-20121228/6548_1 /TAXON_ID=665100 ORGANISM="Litonotus pictus, Strain P1" /NCGR_SAMPLE_ID=MMETSP0209 /ASSEMBLY_ACC=CAM_ASM_000301 /LENGTH=718 /DNA_ID=CAMNT_0010807961 /DNA_START=51 /DNA_END=2203 /DNA_ORIENTATION=+
MNIYHYPELTTGETNEFINFIMNEETSTAEERDIYENSNNTSLFNSEAKTDSKENNHSPIPSNISFHFTNAKAGMSGNNREEINKIIQEATKDSAIYKKNQEDRKKIELHCLELKDRINQLHSNSSLLRNIEKMKEEKVILVKKERILSQMWFHIDMDMFFAAVEIRDNSRLKDFPVAIGDNRMVSTSNYIARKYGVRSAMPGFIAKKLCPSLIFVKGNGKKYHTESSKIMTVLNKYDLYMDTVSLDEAFLDMTGFFNNMGITTIDNTTEDQIIQVIKKIKEEIFKETQLTASIGIASNRLLAKICSDQNKPDGHYILYSSEEAEEEYMKSLRIRKIPSIGEKTEVKYSFLGVNTCQDFLKKSTDMYYILPETSFEHLLKCCLGIGSYYHYEDKSEVNKSISCSETFKVTANTKILFSIFDKLIDKISSQIIEEEIIAQNLCVEVTDNNEEKHSVSETSKAYFETEGDIRSCAYKLLNRILISKKNGLRLLRVKLNHLAKIEQNHKRGCGRETDISVLMKNIPEKLRAMHNSEDDSSKQTNKEDKKEELERARITNKGFKRSRGKKKDSFLVKPLEEYFSEGKESRKSAETNKKVILKRKRGKTTSNKNSISDSKKKELDSNRSNLMKYMSNLEASAEAHNTMNPDKTISSNKKTSLEEVEKTSNNAFELLIKSQKKKSKPRKVHSKRKDKGNIVSMESSIVQRRKINKSKAPQKQAT